MRVYRHGRSPTSWEAYEGGGVCPLPSAYSPYSQRHPSFAQLHRFLQSRFLVVMSQTPAKSAASSHFQAIFQAALKSYRKQTKEDLLAHPLASQLQSCDSTAAIVAVLQEQVREFDKSRSGDERLTKWLGPTVNVLNAFSATVSEGVSLVSLDPFSQCKPDLSYMFCRYFRLRM